MEILIGLVVGGLVLFGLFGLLTFGGIGLIGRSAAKRRAQAIANKGPMLDELFDGREVVTYRVNLETVPADMLIEDASSRGYSLTSRVNVVPTGEASDLVFERRR